MHHNSNSCQTKKTAKKVKFPLEMKKKKETEMAFYIFTCALSSSDDLYSVLGDKYINLQ